jgi:hypothetical protein
MLTGLNTFFVRQGLLLFCLQGRSSPVGRYVRRWVWFSAAHICWDRRRRSVSGNRSPTSVGVRYTPGSGWRGSCCIRPHHAGWRGCRGGAIGPPGSACHRQGNAFGFPSSGWGSGGGSAADSYCRPNGGDTVEYTVGGKRGGASSSVPLPTLEEPEVILRQPLWSGIEPEPTPTPLPQVLSRTHQAL